MDIVWALYSREVPPHINPLIEDWEVQLRNGSWISNQLPQVVGSIIEWKVVWLWLQNNFHSPILKQIKNIRFTDLTQLFLKNNNIESVGGIGALHMPSINIILLGHEPYLYNSTVDPSALQGSEWSGSQYMWIYSADNPISDVHLLTGLHLPTDNQLLELQVFRSSLMCCCLGWILKSEMNLHRLYIRGQGRIRQGRVKQVLRRRTYYMQILEEDY